VQLAGTADAAPGHQTTEQHEQIVSALRRHAPQDAAELMQQHLRHDDRHDDGRDDEGHHQDTAKEDA
jgi:DNA-binding GntR family transcriptional regulator